MTTNPYAPPKSAGAAPQGERWQATWLAPFLSSILAIPIGLALFGVLRRAPDLLTRLDFLLPLIAGSAISALLLRSYTSAGWLVRAILAPPVAFVLYFLIIIVVRRVAA
jgi:hypothetical protein